MTSVLFVAVHPALELSRTNGLFTDAAARVQGVQVHRLYDLYPDFHFDVDHEQALLRSHAHIILQYPLYWYMPPALLKEWMDQVLTEGFAFGESGDALSGKSLTLSLTVGAPEQAYSKEGYQEHDINDFLCTMAQTARFCGLSYHPPLVLYDSQNAGPEAINAHRSQLVDRILTLLDSSEAPPALAAERDDSAALPVQTEPQKSGEPR